MMTNHKEPLHLLPSETDASAEWIEDPILSEASPSPYQRRLRAVGEAENRFIEELSAASEDDNQAS